ncbi:hypothetical protein Emed_000571 [Eimeria media]
MGGGTRWFQAPLLVACLVYLSSSATLWTALAAPVGSRADSVSAYDFSSSTSEDELPEVPSWYSLLQSTSEGDSPENPKKKKSLFSKFKLGLGKKKGSTSSDDEGQGTYTSTTDLLGETEGGGGGTKKKSGKLSLKNIFSKKTKSKDKQASSDDESDSDSDSEAGPRSASRKAAKPRKRSKLTSFFKRSKKNVEASDAEQSGEQSEGTSEGTLNKKKKKGVLRRIFSRKGSKGQQTGKANGPLLLRSPKVLADISAEEAGFIPLLVELPKAKQPMLPADHPSGCMPVQVTKGLEDFVELLPAMGVGCRQQQLTKV